MQERQFGYIRGNTAVVPERKPRISRNNKNKNSILRKKNKEKAIIASRKNDRKYMFLVVAAIFTLGSVTIAGDTKVYNMQRQVTQLNSSIKTMKEENEALKVNLLKYSSLSNIEGNASTKLGMYIPSSSEWNVIIAILPPGLSLFIPSSIVLFNILSSELTSILIAWKVLFAG